MKLAIDYYLRQQGLSTRILHTLITESDIMELLEKKFKDGDLNCPIPFDRQKCKVEFVIETITV